MKDVKKFIRAKKRKKKIKKLTLMLIILFDIILFIFRIIFNLLKFIIKITIGILAFILTKSFLRFPFLLFTIGFLLHINFNTLATIYFLYLVQIIEEKEC